MTTVLADLPPFSTQELAQAQGEGRFLDGLARLESDPAKRLARLSASCGLAAVGHGRLMTLAPDFAALSFETALAR
ncbi:MAG: type II/IV secretion system protein, partial [Zoogloeaceae bacterium]|nr:type II/IV secretion system protein [Zoogloeaceae bacterium]